MKKEGSFSHKEHKFYTTVVAVIIFVFGIIIASRFQDVGVENITLSLALTNTILILITLGVVLQLKDHHMAKRK